MTCRAARRFPNPAHLELVYCCKCGSTDLELMYPSNTFGPHLCLRCVQSLVEWEPATTLFPESVRDLVRSWAFQANGKLAEIPHSALWVQWEHHLGLPGGFVSLKRTWKPPLFKRGGKVQSAGGRPRLWSYRCMPVKRTSHGLQYEISSGPDAEISERIVRKNIRRRIEEVVRQIAENIGFELVEFKTAREQVYVFLNFPPLVLRLPRWWLESISARQMFRE